MDHPAGRPFRAMHVDQLHRLVGLDRQAYHAVTISRVELRRLAGGEVVQ